MVHNETLNNIFWGIVLIWLGTVWGVYFGGNILRITEAISDARFALGVGLLLLLLNLIRTLSRLKLSPLTIGLGALLTVIYAPIVFFGYQVPFLPVLLVIAGIALVIGAFRIRSFQNY
ncbi:MAG: hypothetical protein OK438_01440 [Thaumarchaeota archaeon]|nr:hypothetical protein [Nitrososphaerota archaeon]